MNAVREIPKFVTWQILHPLRIVSNLIDTVIFPNHQRFPPPFSKEKGEERSTNDRKKTESSSSVIRFLLPSWFRTLRLEIRLGKRFHEWANRRRSFSPRLRVQSRRVSPGVSSHSKNLLREEGRRESRVRERRRRTSGQVESRRWSGRVACRVWKRSGPRRTAPLWPSSPLMLVSSWKSIAGKRVKIHPCLRERTWLRGGLARLEAV